MAKKIIQDIVSKNTSPRRSKDEDEQEEDFDDVEVETPKRRAWLSVLFALAGSVLALGVFLILSSTYSRVSMKISTTRKNIPIDEVIFLNKDGSGGGIKYDTMKFTGSESAVVPVTGTKSVEKSTVGSVTIYNSYSNSPQPLVAGTRLETKDGKIFKIDKAVTVPGMATSGGKTTPGSVSVTVKASQPGPDYNIPPADFTILGFKGGPKYTKFSAKSTKNMTGGFIGAIKTSSPEDVKQARTKLEESLRQKLSKDAAVQVPNGLLLYGDAMFLTFKDNSVDDSSLISEDNGEARLKVDATLSAVIISAEDMKNMLASKKLADLGKDTKVVLANIDTLSFKVLNKEKVNLESNNSIMVKIDGNLPVIWDFDESALKARLSGVKKSKYQDIFREFPVIEKAEATFSPSWALYFPNDTSRIEIDKGF